MALLGPLCPLPLPPLPCSSQGNPVIGLYLWGKVILQSWQEKCLPLPSPPSSSVQGAELAATWEREAPHDVNSVITFYLFNI